MYLLQGEMLNPIFFLRVTAVPVCTRRSWEGLPKGKLGALIQNPGSELTPDRTLMTLSAIKDRRTDQVRDSSSIIRSRRVDAMAWPNHACHAAWPGTGKVQVPDFLKYI